MYRKQTPDPIRAQAQARAWQLRQEATPQETRLWSYLRDSRLQGIHFRRQHPIGRYIVDFCALKLKLIIEMDGSQHLEHEEYDAERNEYLLHRGYRVLCFWNSDVMDHIKDVLSEILR